MNLEGLLMRVFKFVLKFAGLFLRALELVQKFGGRAGVDDLVVCFEICPFLGKALNSV